MGGAGVKDRREKSRRFVFKPRVCPFCAEKIGIDYKDISRLQRHISDRGRIQPRRRTGVCAKHQRRLALAIKRTRFLALLPYTPDHARQLGGFERKAQPLKEKQSAEADVSAEENSKKT